MLQRARAGDVTAFGALYDRHLAAARRLARSLLADPSDADDVVAEVFAATFAAMKKGFGPAEDFRSYLLTSVRRECRRVWRRGGRQRPGGDVVIELASARPGIRDQFDDVDESEVVHRAFAALPPRMQHVLWWTEIEGLSHEEVAVRLGASATAVAQLARRARVQFGERYLEAHLPAADDPSMACEAPRRVLAEVVRGTASRRAERMAAEHMATCEACARAHEELNVVNGRLRTGHVLALLPILVASRPARLGLLARVTAWLTGPVPTMSAAASIAVATAVVPLPPDASSAVEASAPPPAGAELVDEGEAPRTTDAGSPPTTAGIGQRSVDPSAFDPATNDPHGRALPTTVADATAPAVPTATAATPVDAGAPGAGAAVPDASEVPPPPGAPPRPPTGGDGALALAEVTGGVQDAVNGITVDDPLVGAVTPVLDAVLPDADVAVALPLSPPLPVVGGTPPIAVEVGVTDRQVDVDADIGSAGVGVQVGGAGGAQIDLPDIPEAVQVLPEPVVGIVGQLPLLGSTLARGG